MICKYIIKQSLSTPSDSGSEYLRETKQNDLYINHVAICVKFTKCTEKYLDKTKEKFENLVMNLAILSISATKSVKVAM